MTIDNAEIALYASAALALLPHVVALVPEPYRSSLGLVGDILNILAGNYLHAKNGTDKQDLPPDDGKGKNLQG